MTAHWPRKIGVLSAALAVGLLTSGCSSLPTGLVATYGSKGWTCVHKYRSARVWVSDIERFRYIITKGDEIVAVIPTDDYSDWVDVYDQNRPAISVQRRDKTILNKSVDPWKIRSGSAK